MNNNTNDDNNNDQTKNKSSTDKNIYGKRKCEFPFDSNTSKKVKLNSKRALSTNNINLINTKVTKTPILNSISRSISSKNLNSQNSKSKFSEGCISNSLNINLRKILEQEKTLDLNLKKLQTSNDSMIHLYILI